MHGKLLKALAVTAFGFTTFPLIITNDVISFKDISVFRLCAYYAVFFLIFFIGYVLGNISKKHRKLLIPFRILGGSTFFSALLLLPFGGGFGIILAAGVSAAFFFFLGERASRKNYADYFPLLMFGIYIIVSLFSYVFYGGLGPEKLIEPIKDAVIISMMLEICLVSLLVNQSGIYDKASRRRETKSMLPKGLSGYNAALVLTITLAGLGLYVFSDKIVWLLRETAKLLIKAVLYIMRGYADFMAVENSEGTELRPAYAAEESTPLWYVLASLALIICIIVFRRQIWSWIKEIGRRIYSFFTRDVEQSAAEPEFIDFSEQTRPTRKLRTTEINEAKLMRMFRNESDAAKKYRIGYRIILKRLNRNKARIVPSDTTSGQYIKSRIVTGEEFSDIVDCYDEIRYSGRTADKEEIIRLEKFIESKGT